MKNFQSNVTDSNKTTSRPPWAFCCLLLIVAIFGGLSGCGSSGGGGGDASSPVPSQEPAPPHTTPTATTPRPGGDGTNTPTPGRVIPLGLIGGDQPQRWGGTSVRSINEAGAVIGSVQGGSYGEVSAWLHANGTTHNISWPEEDSRLPPRDGFNFARGAFNFARGLNKHGEVVGNTQSNHDAPYDASPILAWLYKDGSSIELGLMDHENANPGHYAGLINDAGQVAGSTTWNHENGVSVSAWLYSSGATHPILLSDHEHTGSGGIRNSYPTGLNENGEVAGNAMRFDGNGDAQGNSCWMYSNGSTNKIGLYDQQHTDADTGEKSCWVSMMNDAGQVAGGSTRYPPEIKSGLVEVDGALVDLILGHADGASAWLYQNGTTINIGLVDNKHTSPNGMQRSEVSGLNGSGQVVGFSYRFDPPDMISFSWGGSHNPSSVTAWLYEDGAHTRLGLTDDDHTGADGAQFSAATAINEAGQIVGYSLLSIEGLGLSSCTPTQLFDCGPNTVWLYDPARGETIRLINGHVGKHGAVASNGYSENYITYLSEKGEAVGYYSAYVDGTFSEHRLFYYSHEHGLHDLIDLIPELKQWKPLDQIVGGNGSGYLIGAGTGPVGDGDRVGLLIAPPVFQDES